MHACRRVGGIYPPPITNGSTAPRTNTSERAAILEYQAGYSRPEAERLAGLRSDDGPEPWPKPDLLHARSVALRPVRAGSTCRGRPARQRDVAPLTDADAAVAALDKGVAAALAPECDERAVVLDDNAAIALAVFSSDRQSAAATLNPTAALRLAGWLHAAGVRRLGS